MYTWMHVHVHVLKLVCMYMYVSVYVFMYVCMYVCLYIRSGVVGLCTYSSPCTLCVKRGNLFLAIKVR